jgi:pimeloyl-ACP methyl ester carboxylesterase
MAKIVGVHGIAQQFGSGYQLEDVWYDALRGGLGAADHEPVAEELTAGDVRVAFFGSLFRPEGTMDVLDPELTADDVQPGPEEDLLTVFYEAAVAQKPSLGEPEGAMPWQTPVQAMLRALAGSPTFARIAEPAFVGDLKQVIAFLTDPGVKQDVLARVRKRVSEDTRVVIGHSLGSVVAYEYLCNDQPQSVELLVTLGSPLGIPNVVFDRLTPAPVAGAGAWPGTVATWVNVADRNDIVALRKDLAPLFPGPRGQMVTDRLAVNGPEPHAIDRYLNSKQTGSALGDVLG